MQEKTILEGYREKYPIKKIELMSEKEAFLLMILFRWGVKRKNGEILEIKIRCPKCYPSYKSKVIFTEKKKQWICMGCRHQFTVTSWTIFSGSRMSMKILINLILTYAGTKKRGFPRSVTKKSKELGISHFTVMNISKLINSRINHSLIINSSSVFSKYQKKETIKSELGIHCQPTLKENKNTELTSLIAKFISEGNFKNEMQRLLERFSNYSPRTVKQIHSMLHKKSSNEVKQIALNGSKKL